MDFSQFRTYLEGQDRSNRTVSGYLRDLAHFTRWFKNSNGEALTPTALTGIDVREYRQYMLTVQHASPATVNRKLAAVRAYAAWALSDGQLESNPLAEIRGVREQDNGPRWLEKKEQAALLRQAEKEVNAARTTAAKTLAVRNYTIVILLLNSGLRVGELCALTMDDIEISERKGTLQVRQGKGRKARTIPLNKQARTALQTWLALRPQHGLHQVFTGRRGQALTASAVQRFLAEISRRGGIEATPHILRHTFCKNLVNAGVSLEKIAALAGHESIQTTRRYVEPGAVDLENAVRALEG